MKKKLGLIFLGVLVLGLIIPQRFVNPVRGASNADYNKEAFWYYPWGRSGTHKGVDIFAKEGADVQSSVDGWVLYAGNIEMGGNVVLIIGPKWRLHYLAHLKSIVTPSFTFVRKGDLIGAVGTTGNAAGKQPHLHYSIMTLIPYVWQVDGDPQGWKKMFYLNPIELLSDSQ